MDGPFLTGRWDGIPRQGEGKAWRDKDRWGDAGLGGSSSAGEGRGLLPSPIPLFPSLKQTTQICTSDFTPRRPLVASPALQWLFQHCYSVGQMISIGLGC